jgi:hypothetical protein
MHASLINYSQSKNIYLFDLRRRYLVLPPIIFNASDVTCFPIHIYIFLGPIFSSGIIKFTKSKEYVRLWELFVQENPHLIFNDSKFQHF